MHHKKKNRKKTWPLIIKQLSKHLVALFALVTLVALWLGAHMLHLLRLAVEQLAAGLAVHAQVNPLLMRHPILRRRGDVVAEAALELLTVVGCFDVLFKRAAAVKDQVTVVALAFQHQLAGALDMLATECRVVKDLGTMRARSALKIIQIE